MQQHDQNLTQKKANDFASQLGAINKNFENTYFDIKMQGENLNKEELLDAIKGLAKVINAYEDLNHQLQDHTFKGLSSQSTTVTCRELLI